MQRIKDRRAGIEGGKQKDQKAWVTPLPLWFFLFSKLQITLFLYLIRCIRPIRAPSC